MVYVYVEETDKEWEAFIRSSLSPMRVIPMIFAVRLCKIDPLWSRL